MAERFDREILAERFDRETLNFMRHGPARKNVIRIAVAIIALILLFVLSPFGTIAAGERGVHLRFTAVTGKVFGEGLYFRIPLIESVQTMDVKVQKYEMQSNAASKDLQTVHSVVALNFHIDPDRVANIYQDVGLQFRDRIIDPAMQEAIKASTAKFTAEELITKREMVRDEIKAQLTSRLKGRNILVDEFNIVNFDFSKNFNDAIEAKVTAEQQALAAKNKLEQIKFEADQKIAEARGKAEAMTIESNALRSNPQILELRALEKWNGTLPQVTGGAVPFINLPK
jgi:prohibitin 2